MRILLGILIAMPIFTPLKTLANILEQVSGFNINNFEVPSNLSIMRQKEHHIFLQLILNNDEEFSLKNKNSLKDKDSLVEIASHLHLSS